MTDEVQKFLGKWKLDRSENFDDFLKEMGVNALLRKMAGASKPEQEISLDGDTLTAYLHTTFWSSHQTIKLNQEFDHVENKIKMKCHSETKDGKLIVHMNPIEQVDKVKPQTIYREIIDDELVLTLYVGDIICKRIFKRIE